MPGKLEILSRLFGITFVLEISLFFVGLLLTGLRKLLLAE